LLSLASNAVTDAVNSTRASSSSTGGRCSSSDGFSRRWQSSDIRLRDGSLQRLNRIRRVNWFGNMTVGKWDHLMEVRSGLMDKQ
jgi:hypothetical protein